MKSEGGMEEEEEGEEEEEEPGLRCKYKDRSLLLHFIFPFFLASSTLPLGYFFFSFFSSLFTRVGKKARLGTEKACYPRASWRC